MPLTEMAFKESAALNRPVPCDAAPRDARLQF